MLRLNDTTANASFEKMVDKQMARAANAGPARQLQQPTAAALAAMIDHTLLKPEATRAMVIQACEEALQYGFAAVCVNPYNVPYCFAVLKGTRVAVCSVTGFPLGAAQTSIKAAEARQGIKDGAVEIDMVLNVGALKDRCYRTVRDDIARVVRVCHDHGALLKVILETCLLTELEKVSACLLARDAQADFVKTSTGLNAQGATVPDIRLMHTVVGQTMQVKAAGGIRSLETALSMVNAGAARIGTSSGVKIMAELA